MARQRADRTDLVPTFSTAERDARWTSLRERMYQRGLDALVIWGSNYNRGVGNANLRYVTHIPASSRAIALFPHEGDPVVWGELHHSHVPYSLYDLYQDWVDDSRPLEGMGAVATEIEERDLDGGRIGIVGFGNQFAPPFMVPHSEFRGLTERLSGVEFQDTTDLVERDRLIKSDEEIEMLRNAADIGRTMAESFMEAEPGMTEAEVYADMVRTQIAEGGEPYVFNFFDSGSPTADEFEHLLHGKPEPLAPTQRTLEEGDVLMTEYHAGYGGVLAGIEKSVVLGSAPDELEAIHEICLECVENGLERLEPGARFGEVVDAIRMPAREAGMEFVELGMHGHGFGSPEFPTSVYSQDPTGTYPEGMGPDPLSDRGIRDVRIRERMVFGLNIDVYDPDWREDVGLMFGDTVVVTDDGAEKLVETPTDLVV